MRSIIICVLLMSQILYSASLEKNIEKCGTNANYENYQACIDITNLLKNKSNLSRYEQRIIGLAYYNQGIFYRYTMNDYKNAVILFEKAYKYNYQQYSSDVLTKLGFYYNEGKGVKKNKIKGYNYYMEGARLGNENCQTNLDILCKESPWACK